MRYYCVAEIFPPSVWTSLAEAEPQESAQNSSFYGPKLNRALEGKKRERERLKRDLLLGKYDH